MCEVESERNSLSHHTPQPSANRVDAVMKIRWNVLNDILVRKEGGLSAQGSSGQQPDGGYGCLRVEHGRNRSSALAFSLPKHWVPQQGLALTSIMVIKRRIDGGKGALEPALIILLRVLSFQDGAPTPRPIECKCWAGAVTQPGARGLACQGREMPPTAGSEVVCQVLTMSTHPEHSGSNGTDSYGVSWRDRGHKGEHLFRWQSRQPHLAFF